MVPIRTRHYHSIKTEFLRVCLYISIIFSHSNETIIAGSSLFELLMKRIVLIEQSDVVYSVFAIAILSTPMLKAVPCIFFLVHSSAYLKHYHIRMYHAAAQYSIQLPLAHSAALASAFEGYDTSILCRRFGERE